MVEGGLVEQRLQVRHLVEVERLAAEGFRIGPAVEQEEVEIVGSRFGSVGGGLDGAFWRGVEGPREKLDDEERKEDRQEPGEDKEHALGGPAECGVEADGQQQVENPFQRIVVQEAEYPGRHVFR